MSKVITANTLATGTVVFLGPGGAWVAAIEEAESFIGTEAADAALALAKADEVRALIVDPFVVDREERVGRPPMTLRNTIRAHGPTIDYRPASAAPASGTRVS